MPIRYFPRNSHPLQVPSHGSRMAFLYCGIPSSLIVRSFTHHYQNGNIRTSLLVKIYEPPRKIVKILGGKIMLSSACCNSHTIIKNFYLI